MELARTRRLRRPTRCGRTCALVTRRSPRAARAPVTCCSAGTAHRETRGERETHLAGVRRARPGFQACREGAPRGCTALGKTEMTGFHGVALHDEGDAALTSRLRCARVKAVRCSRRRTNAGKVSEQIRIVRWSSCARPVTLEASRRANIWRRSSSWTRGDSELPEGHRALAAAA